MDTSKEYIRMCERAEEIQKNWRPAVEDDVYIHSFETVSFIKNEVFYKGYFIWGFPTQITKEDLIWLPRQDQLQEMIMNMECSNIMFWDLCMKAGGWLCFGRDIAEEIIYPREKIIYEEDYSKTAEQALLKMVMKEKYNKIWNGKEWEVENELVRKRSSQFGVM